MTVPQLNRRLGETLGLVCSGTLPRYAWKRASEMPIVADSIGDVWLLTEWRRPSMTPEQWAIKSSGRWPYPASGHYHPYFESALEAGMEPTPEITQFYISTIGEQMSATQELIQRGLDEKHAANKRRDRAEWVDFVQDSGEAFCNPLKGKVAVPMYGATNHGG